MVAKFDYNKYTRRVVLVVEDEFVNRELLGFILKNDYEVLYAENGKQALEIIKENKKLLSLVLLDLLMPEMNGFELLDILKGDEELAKIPVIVLTSEESAEVKSLQMGAVDFIKKPYSMPEAILARVARIIELSERRFIIQSAEKDELTGLYTRDFFFEYSMLTERYHPEKDMDAVVLDIDRFHLVNEIYGREYGDNLLKLIAKSIDNLFGDIDGIACRAEADTFFIYCAHQTDYDALMKKILAGLSDISVNPRARLRMGVYPSVDKNMEIEQRFDRAVSACNTLRGNYTRAVALYDDALHDKDIYSERLINDMPYSLENNRFKVFFQPKYNIQGDTPVLRSAEALIRWQHPELGMISPGDFIPLFEENGLISHLDWFVWKEAGRQIKAWRDKFGKTVPVSVNVSRIDIYDPEIEDKLLGILKDNDLTTDDLLLEITESAYAEDSKQMIEVINRLRSLGFKIEMDDFGSGYSSLNMLTELPIDILKLDMIFVRNMHKEEKSLRLVELIMEIARFLSVPVVAEGVEEEAQYKLLKDLGCDVIQGYYFSKPVPSGEFEEFIKKEI